MKKLTFSHAIVKSHWERVVITILLGVHTILVAAIAFRKSPTNDEVAHLTAGISIWHFGRFDLYNVNPPLVKLLAALPVVASRPETDWHRYNWLTRSEFIVGLDFIEANGQRVFWYYTEARLACIPLSLLGCSICFRWAKELYGPEAGVLTALLWCFCPNILANASMITPDLGATAVGLLASYAFWHWLRVPTWTRAIVAGIALGAAELTKTTWVILFVLWPVTLIFLGASRWTTPRIFTKQMLQVISMFGVSLYLINACYGFEGSFKPLGSYSFASELLAGPRPGRGAFGLGNRFSGTFMGAIPVPLPENYVAGIDVQKGEMDEGKLSYLRGKYRNWGWWYYYLYALAVKVPLGSWGLLALAAGLTLTRRYAACWRDEAFLLIPIAAILALVSAHVGINRHIRYVLPVFPYAFIWASKAAKCIRLGDARVAVAVGGCVIWSVLGSLSAYPHSLSYFNELAGGPKGGHRHLLGSNIDWGQDLFELKRWTASNPDSTPLFVDCTGIVDPRCYGIDYATFPTSPRPGWYALSVGQLHYPGGRYAKFLNLRPAAMAGYSIYIYQLDQGTIEREAMTEFSESSGDSREAHHPDPLLE